MYLSAISLFLLGSVLAFWMKPNEELDQPPTGGKLKVSEAAA